MTGSNGQALKILGHKSKCGRCGAVGDSQIKMRGLTLSSSNTMSLVFLCEQCLKEARELWSTFMQHKSEKP